jgi:hypothetical protein
MRSNSLFEVEKVPAFGDHAGTKQLLHIRCQISERGQGGTHYWDFGREDRCVAE